VPVEKNSIFSINPSAELEATPTPVVANSVPGQEAPQISGSRFFLFGFFETLKGVIFHPAKFFSERQKDFLSAYGLSSALAFAVTVEWIADFFSFIWKMLAGSLLQRHANDLTKAIKDVLESNGQLFSTQSMESMEGIRSIMSDFVFGAFSILLSPFATIIKLCVGAAFIHIAVRFFINDEEPRRHYYKNTLKILAVATAPSVLYFIPFFGAIAAWILSFLAAVIGIREVYKTTNFRATVAVLFPQILGFVLLISLALMIVFFVFSFVQLLTN